MRSHKILYEGKEYYIYFFINAQYYRELFTTMDHHCLDINEEKRLTLIISVILLCCQTYYVDGKLSDMTSHI